MSESPSIPSSVVPTWIQSSMLRGMLRGVERETLRMTPQGFLAQSAHPRQLGSALTHPHITTDYSEALLELITPPLASIPEMMDYLDDLHQVVYDALEEDESLWPLSMPCMLEEDENQIPLAHYGSSNIGRFKTLYRRGLGVRYGRRMQTIAGVHYNLSFPDALFEALQANETDAELQKLSLQDYRSHRYFGLVRNFIRLTPMVMYLLGASPSVCRCFLTGKRHHLLPLVQGTLFLPEATALRMGNFGYQNSAQKQLGIHYNDLQGYLTGMQRAVKTSYTPFSRLGLDDAQGEPLQINDHVLQIENEYYSLVRPKQVPLAGETPSEALANRGVAYIELRAVDVDPYQPTGLGEQSAAFLESLALYCLLMDSPHISEQEQSIIEQNQTEVVNRGRAANAKIVSLDGEYALQDWLDMHLSQMQRTTALLDEQYQTDVYQSALQTMQQRIHDADDTLSAQVVNDILHAGSTWQFGSQLVQRHRQYYAAHILSNEKRDYFHECAVKSVEKQAQLEQDTSVSFRDYLSSYRGHTDEVLSGEA